MPELSSAWHFRLKAAQRDLIDMAGGIERAAALTSVSKSQVGRWRNPTDPDVIAITAALLLEAECGTPLVTTVMAELNGRRLADPDESNVAAGNVLVRHAEAVRQAGELMAQGAMAFADGKLTPAEAAALDRASASTERALSELRMAIAGVRGTGFSVVEGGADRKAGL
jgi:hypothetical protein